MEKTNSLPVKAIERSVAEIVRSENSLFNDRQVQTFFQPTPKSKVRSRTAKGGGEWKYVDGGYVTQTLNLMFGYHWDKQILTPMSEMLDVALKTGCVAATVRFVGHIGNQVVVKEDVGRCEVKFKKGTKEPLDFGNDVKGAVTDGLKRCAVSLGLFADIYSPDDYLTVQIKEDASTDRIAARFVENDQKNI